jgi:hypothetical protein
MSYKNLNGVEKTQSLLAASEVIFALNNIDAIEDISIVALLVSTYLRKVGIVYSDSQTLNNFDKFIDEINNRGITSKKIYHLLTEHLA